VLARLDLALERAGGAWILALSAGTPHAAPRGVYESVAAARYLIGRGYDPRRVLVEWSSYDTIGNAYFARMNHTEPAGLARLLVVTSEFHLPRTEAIFRWVFGLTPRPVDYSLAFASSPNRGLDADTLAARTAREQESLREVERLSGRYRSLQSFHHWLSTSHGVYAAARMNEARPALDPRLAESY
jgi:uncharacterized SAM-binding protein YcdF (DUF218 family)